MMSLNVGIATETNTITLATPKILDFSVCQEFWDASQQARDRDVKFIIDMAQTNAILGSGYKMLLMLGECASKAQRSINIVNCSSSLQSKLQARGFERYFTFCVPERRRISIASFR
jgi:hypothetical protein